MNYTNREVVRRLKQYDMFLNSLELASRDVQRERICDQLDKIEKQILLETNSEYEQDYLLLFNEETSFFEDEKKRLCKLINLINDRKKYLNDRKIKHRNITGSLVELTTFLGEDKLNVFKKRLEIIEKYEENVVRHENLIKEMKRLDVKLSEASRIVKANTRLNDILENKMREVVSKALDKLDLFVLTGKREEIIRVYETQEFAYNLAKGNLKSAKEIGDEKIIFECDEMLSHVSSEFSKYKEKVNILKLIDIYDNTVTGYEELLEKREKMNDIIRELSDSELYHLIADELNKQYNTIKLEGKDIEKYEALKEEREIKNRTLYDIEEENNSKEFKSVIDELVKNENRVREEQIRQAKKEEYQKRQQKLLEEQKIEASRVRRQKLIEEARLKEQQERLEKVKELQEKTVINTKKEEKIKPVVKEEKVKITKEEDIKNEDKINNPLKDKTLEEVLSYNNDFDTDELFENTKIVPNKVLKEEKSIFEDMTETVLENNDIVEENTENSILSENEMELPVWGEVNDNQVSDLFKEESKVEELVIEDKPKLEEEIIEDNVVLPVVELDAVEEKIEPIKEEKKQPSIYDILENNKNIIWKTTDSKVNKDSIPVIGNNNLKPEMLDSRFVNNTAFPKLESGKDGEILWKETL